MPQPQRQPPQPRSARRRLGMDQHRRQAQGRRGPVQRRFAGGRVVAHQPQAGGPPGARLCQQLPQAGPVGRRNGLGQVQRRLAGQGRPQLRQQVAAPGKRRIVQPGAVQLQQVVRDQSGGGGCTGALGRGQFSHKDRAFGQPRGQRREVGHRQRRGRPRPDLPGTCPAHQLHRAPAVPPLRDPVGCGAQAFGLGLQRARQDEGMGRQRRHLGPHQFVERQRGHVPVAAQAQGQCLGRVVGQLRQRPRQRGQGNRAAKAPRQQPVDQGAGLGGQVGPQRQHPGLARRRRKPGQIGQPRQHGGRAGARRGIGRRRQHMRQRLGQVAGGGKAFVEQPVGHLGGGAGPAAQGCAGNQAARGAPGQERQRCHPVGAIQRAQMRNQRRNLPLGVGVQPFDQPGQRLHAAPPCPSAGASGCASSPRPASQRAKGRS